MLYEMNFDGRGLTPIVVEGLELGDAVRYARDGGLYWVTGTDMHGYVITNAEGRQHHGQRLGTPSPFTRIEKIADKPKLSRMQIEDLILTADKKRETDRLAAEQAKEAHNKAFTEAVERVKAKYPNRVPDDAKLSSYARAAKNIRIQLKATFPNTKFSVRCDSGSMTDSVNVSWTLGPSDAEVSAIVDRYQQGSFDGMQDMYEYDHDAEREAFRAVMGSTKYTFTRREIPEEFSQRVINDIRSSYGTAPDGWELSRQAYQAINPVSLYGKEYIGVECSTGQFLIVVK